MIKLKNKKKLYEIKKEKRFYSQPQLVELNIKDTQSGGPAAVTESSFPDNPTHPGQGIAS